MEADWEKFRRDHGNPQTREDTLSLRRDVFHFNDPANGRKQFQDFVLKGTNRDSDGDLKLQFGTSILRDNGVFSSNVFSDRRLWRCSGGSFFPYW